MYVELFTSEPASPPVNLDQMAKWLKVLAEPNRLLIFHFLMEGVQCNCELGDGLEMAPNLISHHLRVLREAGLVDVERDARMRVGCTIRSTARRWKNSTRPLGHFFDPAADQTAPPDLRPAGRVYSPGSRANES